MQNHRTVWFRLCFTLALSLPFLSHAGQKRFCLDPKPRLVDTSTNHGRAFAQWKELLNSQQALLSSFLLPREASIAYTALTIEQDGKAAAYLAITHALSVLEALPGRDGSFTGLDLIKEIKEVRTDRLIVTLNLDLLKKWQTGNGAYAITTATGKLEEGKLGFLNHSTPRAGLHCGYDLQWYTNASKTPHLHWNVRLSDGAADVHLDGIASSYMGIIPNPLHLTYENSDVRYWFLKYLRKFGNPGFSVKREVASITP